MNTLLHRLILRDTTQMLKWIGLSAFIAMASACQAPENGLVVEISEPETPSNPQTPPSGTPSEEPGETPDNGTPTEPTPEPTPEPEPMPEPTPEPQPVAPAVPANVSINSATTNSLSLSWNAVSYNDPINYQIQRFMSNLDEWVNIANTSQTQYSDNNLTPATTYQYRIAAMGNALVSDYSASVTGTTDAMQLTTLPYNSTPIVLPGRIEAEQYDLSNASPAFLDNTTENEGGAFRTDSVDVEATTDTGGGFNIGYIESGEWLTYTVQVERDVMAELQLRTAARDQDGSLRIELNGASLTNSIATPTTFGWQNWETTTSEPVTLTAGTHEFKVIFDGELFNLNYIDVVEINNMPFNAPSNLSAMVIDRSILLSWNDNSSQEDAFQIQRRVDGGNWDRIATVVNDTIAYTDREAPINAALAYRVRAVNSNESTNYSNVFSTTIEVDITPSAPAAPSFAMAQTEDDNILVYWQQVNGVQQYRLERKINNGNWELLSLTSDSEYTETNLQAETSYSYRVYSVANNLQSTATLTNTITTAAIEPPPVVDNFDMAAAAELYGDQCAGCHGADGLGGPFKKPLTSECTVCNDVDQLTLVILETMPLNSANVCDADCSATLATYIDRAFVNPEGETPEEPEPPVTEEPVACTDEQAPEVALRLLTRKEYQNTVSDLFGTDIDVTTNFPVEATVNGYSNNSSVATVTSRHVDGYLAAAKTLATTALAANSVPAQCSVGTSTNDCANGFVQDFGKLAFRRPLTNAEVATYTSLFNDNVTAGDVNTGMRLAIESMLISPNFLYRSEVGSIAGDSYELDDYEIASSLSYLLWGSMPDAQLFAAADNGDLSTASGLRTQAERLLDDDRAKPQLGQFANEWLHTEGVLNANKDKVIYPEFTDTLRESMAAELEAFVTYTFLESGGQYQDLLVNSNLFIDSTLANFYGIDGNFSDELTMVNSPNRQRGGLLGMGAVLASHAHSNESSPIKRGHFIRERLLCQELPDPPANLDTTPPGLDPTLTTRERFRIHTDDQACSSCHQYIDDLGFGFEGYDGIGAYREVENGIDVDQSGELLGLDSLNDPTRYPFNGPLELADAIVTGDSAPKCLTRQYYRFAYGISETAQDECAIEKLSGAFAEDNYTLRQLIINLIQQDSFVSRRASASE